MEKPRHRGKKKTDVGLGSSKTSLQETASSETARVLSVAYSVNYIWGMVQSHMPSFLALTVVLIRSVCVCSNHMQ